jgi:hypothetical protein
MRNGFLGAIVALLLGSGLLHAQMPYPTAYGAWPGYYNPTPYSAPYYWPPAYPAYPPPPAYNPRYADPGNRPASSSTTSFSSPVANSSPPPEAPCPLEPPPPIAGVSVFGSKCPTIFRGFDPAQEQSYDLWVSAEYLYWWPRPTPTPVPLATTGSPTDPIPGAIGQPTTQVLVGGGDTSFNGSNGVRLTLGTWFDQGHRFGLEFSGFCFENTTTTFMANNGVVAVPVLIPAGTPLALPAAGENAVPIVSPVAQANPLNLGSTNLGGIVTGGPYSGSLSISQSTRLWGLELNGVVNLYRSRGFSLDVLAGARYLNLQESLSLNASSTDLVLAVTDTYNDSFQSSNQFIGGQLGVRANAQYGIFFMGATLNAALGTNMESSTVGGSTTQSSAGVASTYAGGILTQPSNIGSQSQTVLSVVPQVQFKLGVELVPNVRIFAGYDFLYWTNVVRASNQVDHTVNPSQSFGGTLSGPTNPAPMFNQSNYFIQGVSVGMEVRF